MNQASFSLPRIDKWKLVLIVLAVIGASVAAGLVLPAGIDWHATYRPVSIMAMQGKSPYRPDPDAFFPYAPWALIPLIPLGLLPENIGRGAFFVLAILGYSYFAMRLGANRYTLPLFLISPPVLHCLLNANIDWIAILGYALPPQIGIFFLLVKPQVGIGGVIFWLVISWYRGGFRETLRVFLPVTIVTLLSFVVFGLWPLSFIRAMQYSWNASLWPLSIPVGLVLMVQALRQKDIRFSMAASPCLSPYVLFHSWAGALGAILSDTVLTLTAVIGLWGVIIFRGLGII